MLMLLLIIAPIQFLSPWDLSEELYQPTAARGDCSEFWCGEYLADCKPALPTLPSGELSAGKNVSAADLHHQMSIIIIIRLCLYWWRLRSHLANSQLTYFLSQSVTANVLLQIYKCSNKTCLFPVTTTAIIWLCYPRAGQSWILKYR